MSLKNKIRLFFEYKIKKPIKFFRRNLIIKRNFPKGVIVDGDYKKIFIGTNTIIEPGVVLSIVLSGKITIGNNCEIRRGTIISTHGGDIVIGNSCSLNPYCVIYGMGGLKIDDYVRIATHTSIVPSNHRIDSIDELIINQGLSKIGIKINKNVWIGAGVVILDGTVINEGVVVAAGAVVKGIIKKNTVIGGIPAKIIKYRQNNIK
ncbi:MAG: acyltransferase [Bacteroidetes bacterium]|nr:MAG: acyltransferase [Bacteroidota bacterium]